MIRNETKQFQKFWSLPKKTHETSAKETELEKLNLQQNNEISP